MNDVQDEPVANKIQWARHLWMFEKLEYLLSSGFLKTQRQATTHKSFKIIAHGQKLKLTRMDTFSRSTEDNKFLRELLLFLISRWFQKKPIQAHISIEWKKEKITVIILADTYNHFRFHILESEWFSSQSFSSEFFFIFLHFADIISQQNPESINNKSLFFMTGKCAIEIIISYSNK